MGCEQAGVTPVNQFALVSYLPDPLGKFLDWLRLRLVPQCRPHAHVTVLPPRPIHGTAEEAAAEIKSLAVNFQPFEIKLGRVQMFGVTKVIYIEIERGEQELRAMHDEFNHGVVYYDEPFEFHPHITIGQCLPPDQVDEIFERAQKLWDEWKGATSFSVEKVSFVQNTEQNVWLDISQIPLVPEHAQAVR